jgi:hypothetical protein
MSTYNTLDEGPVTEFSVHRVQVWRKRHETDRAAHDVSETAYLHLRKAQPVTEPLPVTVRWIARLPQNVRPLNLLRQFPRVANALATNWTDPRAFRTYLYNLLVDTRGNRKGFPPEVLAELMTLRSYFENVCV